MSNLFGTENNIIALNLIIYIYREKININKSNK